MDRNRLNIMQNACDNVSNHPRKNKQKEIFQLREIHDFAILIKNIVKLHLHKMHKNASFKYISLHKWI